MATINEIAEQHVAALEVLAAQPAPDSARATYEYALAAAVEIEWLGECFAISLEDRSSPSEETDLDRYAPAIPTADAEVKVWYLPGEREFTVSGENSAGEFATRIGQSLQTIISGIEVAMEELETSDEMVQPLSTLGLNLTISTIRLAIENPNLSSPDRLSMRAMSFCLRGMKSGQPEQNLHLLSRLDSSFIAAAKFFAPCTDYDSMQVSDDGIEDPNTIGNSALWTINEQVAAKLDPIDLTRAESFLRAAKGAWSSGLRFIDPAVQHVAKIRAEDLGMGADVLRAIASGRPPTEHSGPQDISGGR